MTISIDDIKKLRAQTGAGMMDAKNALTEAEGEMDKAVEVLRKKGLASAAKRADREAGNGLIASYVHSERIGVIVEVNCETDFVARTDDFKNFAKEVAMHIAAFAPLYLDPQSVPEAEIAKERQIYEAESGDKPAEVVAKIVEGKLAKFYEQVCLVKQPFVKDSDKSVEAVTAEIAAKVGENVKISRFHRLELGVE